MIQKIQRFLMRRKLLRGLIKRYKQDLILEELTGDWISRCIIERKQEFRRKELIESQQKTKEFELFLKYLKTLK